MCVCVCDAWTPAPNRALHHALLRQVVQLGDHRLVVVAEGAGEHGVNLGRHLLRRRFAGFALPLRRRQSLSAARESERGKKGEDEDEEGEEQKSLVLRKRNTGEMGQTLMVRRCVSFETVVARALFAPSAGNVKVS